MTIDHRGTAVVTGASRGIGRALAEGLAAAGFRIGLIAQNAHRLAEVEAHIAASGGVGAAAVADVTVPDQVAGAVAVLENRLGPVDLLVNNAGIADRAEVPVWEADPDDWWRVLEVNLRGPYLVSRAVMPDLRERGGRIVTITGMVQRAVPGYSAYTASKAALSRLTESLAQAGVRAFDLSPGMIRTDLTSAMPMLAGAPEEAFASPDRALRFVLAIADGRLDALAGRYFHAQHDDLDDVLKHAAAILDNDARRLRISRYAATDPMR